MMPRLLMLSLLLATVLIGCASQPTVTPTSPPPTDTPVPPTPTDTPEPSATATETALPPTATPSPTALVLTGVVNAATLNVRAAPSQTSEKVGELKKGDTVILMSRSADSKWLEINFPLGASTTGWVTASFVDVTTTVLDALPVAAAQVTATSVSTEVAVTTITPTATKTPSPTRVLSGPVTATATVSGTIAATSTPLPSNAAGAAPGSVIFDSFVNGKFQINQIRADGTGLHMLIAGGSEPALRPDNVTLAYHARNGLAGLGIATSNLDGSNLKILDSDSTAGYPTWGPDGNNIVYDTMPGGNQARQLWRLTFPPSGPRVEIGLGVRPAWRPGAGDLVLFDGCNNGNTCYSLYEQHAFTPAVNSPIFVSGGTNPAWSPNGSEIAFQQSDAKGHLNIFIENSSGGNRRQLTNNTGNTGVPIWSRDGQWIFYRSDKSGVWAIYEIRVDGSAERKLVDANVNASLWDFEKLAIAP